MKRREKKGNLSEQQELMKKGNEGKEAREGITTTRKSKVKSFRKGRVDGGREGERDAKMTRKII